MKWETTLSPAVADKQSFFTLAAPITLSSHFLQASALGERRIFLCHFSIVLLFFRVFDQRTNIKLI